MAHNGMSFMDERHVANRVDLMVWCSRLDLLALSNYKGEVQVHRLQWQKVWNLPPPKETSRVQGMAWRPDGKALAVGYSCGRVCIVDVEDKETLHSFTVEDEYPSEPLRGVTSITWAVKAGSLVKEHNLYEDASIFLPNPPTLNSGYKNKKDDEASGLKELQEQTQLNILIVGYGCGKVHLSIFGRFPCGSVNLPRINNDCNIDYNILDAYLSDDFSLMHIFYSNTQSNNLNIAVVNTDVLSAFADELFSIASKHSQIVHYLSYMDQTMISITEAWEHILLEMDSKMSDYAAMVAPGGVSADLLELLMLGVPSVELEMFLLQELTVKGLKKCSSSVELSYSTIQKLVLKQLNVVGQSLAYNLSELRGLARIPDRYKILGLDETTVTEAIRASCAFLNKCLELQQVIDLSMRNYKAFFRWLYVVIVRLLDEQTPTEIVKITQQELTYIAEFLYNFDTVGNDSQSESGNKKPVKFNLERLAQYLQDKELSILPDDEDNPWHKFLKENPCLLKDNETIINMTEFRKYSLIQQQSHLRSAIGNIFDVSEKNIGGHFHLIANIQCYENQVFGNPTEKYKVTQIYDPKSRVNFMAFTYLPNAADGICFIATSFETENFAVKGANFYFDVEQLNDSKLDTLEKGNNLIIADAQFYSTEFLSILLQHPHDEDVSLFIQFPVKAALSHCSEISLDALHNDFHKRLKQVEGCAVAKDSVRRIIEKMPGYKIAVSGGRKVVAILSKSCRKLRVYEMEGSGDDDEDETLDTTPQSHSTTQLSDASQGTPLADTSVFPE